MCSQNELFFSWIHNSFCNTCARWDVLLSTVLLIVWRSASTLTWSIFGLLLRRLSIWCNHQSIFVLTLCGDHCKANRRTSVTLSQSFQKSLNGTLFDCNNSQIVSFGNATSIDNQMRRPRLFTRT